MTCDTVQELTSGLIDGELDRETAETVRVHLDDCAQCRDHFESITALSDAIRAGSSIAMSSVTTSAITGSTPAVSAPAGLWDRIEAEAVSTLAAPLPWRPHARFKWTAMAAAALIVIALPVYFGVFHATPSAMPSAQGPDAHVPPAGLALAKYVREIQSGTSEPQEFLALHDGREVAIAELAGYLNFEPMFPSCVPDGLTLEKCYVLRTADGNAVGCAYGDGSQRMMVFQQHAGDPVLNEGLPQGSNNVCGTRCKSILTGSVRVLYWDGGGRTTTIVCSEVDAAKLDALVDSLQTDN